MKDNLEEMLRSALTPSEKPDAWLNQNIVNSVQKSQTEAEKAGMEVAMRKSWMKRMPAVALAAVVLLSAGSLTAYAAWQYLKPDQVAEQIEDQKLADAFRGEDAVRVDESQSYGGYTVTLLGLLSGKDLSQYQSGSDGEILSDRTYAVVALENEDGTPMQDSGQEGEERTFLASPLIKGENPSRMNIFYMNGGYSSFVEDGVLYRVVECDNLQAFAKRGVYLSVTNTIFYDSDAYVYDKKSGEITRNEDYKGLNALFQLPLDVSKADQEKAEEQMKKWKNDVDGSSEGEAEDTDERDWDIEKLQKNAELIPETVETVTPDKDGYIYYEWNYQGTKSSGERLIRGLFKDSKTVILGVSQTNDGKDLIEVATKNEDGTIQTEVYCEK